MGVGVTVGTICTTKSQAGCRVSVGVLVGVFVGVCVDVGVG